MKAVVERKTTLFGRQGKAKSQIRMVTVELEAHLAARGGTNITEVIGSAEGG
jgi:hypothetical protein